MTSDTLATELSCAIDQLEADNPAGALETLTAYLTKHPADAAGLFLPGRHA